MTSTACKPNQPHESTSSTSKIETTTTTTPTIEDPNKEIKIKRNELINMIENEFNNRGDNYKNSEKIIYVTKHWGDDYSCTVGALFQDEKKLTGVLSGRITEEDYMYLINNIAPNALQEVNVADFIIRFSDNYNDEHQGIKESTKNINKIEDEKVLLRSQTSPVQARTMLKGEGKTPIRMICPGKTYRRDDDDATHSHQFMQFEGLVVDKNITMSDLKGTLTEVFDKILGKGTKVRFRPSYFPFTEPSVEVDVTCFKCGGKGCPLCKGNGWIEILGAGMVHPNVLKMAGYDPEKYQGFAFGIGIERITMLKLGIDDIRNFYINDPRFTKQF